MKARELARPARVVPVGYNQHADFPDLLRQHRTRERLSQLDLAIRADTTQRHLMGGHTPQDHSARVHIYARQARRLLRCDVSAADPAVHQECRCRDEGGVVAGEKRDRRRYLVCFAEPAHRDVHHPPRGPFRVLGEQFL